MIFILHMRSPADYLHTRRAFHTRAFHTRESFSVALLLIYVAPSFSVYSQSDI